MVYQLPVAVTNPQELGAFKRQMVSLSQARSQSLTSGCWQNCVRCRGFRRKVSAGCWHSLAGASIPWGAPRTPDSSLIPDSQNMETEAPKLEADISAPEADGVYGVQAPSPGTLSSWLWARTSGSELPQIQAGPEEQRERGQPTKPAASGPARPGFLLLLDSKNRSWYNTLHNNEL